MSEQKLNTIKDILAQLNEIKNDVDSFATTSTFIYDGSLRYIPSLSLQSVDLDEQTDASLKYAEIETSARDLSEKVSLLICEILNSTQSHAASETQINLTLQYMAMAKRIGNDLSPHNFNSSNSIYIQPPPTQSRSKPNKESSPSLGQA